MWFEVVVHRDRGIPLNNAMKIGQFMQTVGHEYMLLRLMTVNEKEKR
jgi:hypothetical protein